MTETTKQWLAFGGGVAVTALLALGGYAYLTQERPVLARTMTAAPPPKAARATVPIKEDQARRIGLQLTTVASSDLTEELRVVATVAPDESRISHIHTRVAGWIEKLHIANTGETVAAGQPVADIFSQELFSSQVEYLAARRMTAPPSQVVESGRARLQFFGMSEQDIAAIEKSGKPRRVVTLVAPRTGIVAHRGVSAGTAVDPSTEIATILDLSRVWVIAEVPAAFAGHIRKGMRAELEFGDMANVPVAATVEFVDPLLSEATRTLRVRFSLPNTKGVARPGTYGTAVFRLPPRHALTVPRDAVVDVGATQYVYVTQGDGNFAPRAVRTGARLQDTIEIVDGLHQGDQIVSSGVFLLDSESRLRASGTPAGGHGGHPGPGKHPADGGAHD